MEHIYEEIYTRSACVCMRTRWSWTTSKGRIEGGTRRTVVFLDEQRRQSRPLGPVITLRPTPKDIFVEREIKCDSAQPLPVIFKVCPVAWQCFALGSMHVDPKVTQLRFDIYLPWQYRTVVSSLHDPMQ